MRTVCDHLLASRSNSPLRPLDLDSIQVPSLSVDVATKPPAPRAEEASSRLDKVVSESVI